ncbi:hypothetical protein FF1_012896 [Malus domestica]
MGWTSHTAVMEEDDDEFDVDMLNISSGDDEFTAKVQQRARFREGKAASIATSRRGSQGDDDAAWDGGKPGCWKHVNEAELATRVTQRTILIIRNTLIAT